jgi:hypothetical protein
MVGTREFSNIALKVVTCFARSAHSRKDNEGQPQIQGLAVWRLVSSPSVVVACCFPDVLVRSCFGKSIVLDVIYYSSREATRLLQRENPSGPSS